MLGREFSNTNFRRRCLGAAGALLAGRVLAAPPEAATPAGAPRANGSLPPVFIDYFYEAGCADCFKVRDRVMPELKECFEGFYELSKWDVGAKSNVVRLIAYQERLRIGKNEPVMMVVDQAHVLNEFAAIETGLLARIDEAVAERMEPVWREPEPIPVPESPAEAAEGRMARFAPWAVAFAGLTDGVNPCAISTLVFFMSLLGVARVSGRKLLLMGASFCMASFLAYSAIGLGLLRALHLFAGFKALRAALEATMVIALAVLFFLSFRDAVRYGRSARAGDVALRLPGIQPRSIGTRENR